MVAVVVALLGSGPLGMTRRKQAAVPTGAEKIATHAGSPLARGGLIAVMPPVAFVVTIVVRQFAEQKPLMAPAGPKQRGAAAGQSIGP